MIILGIVFILTALIFISFAWRGRVTARGQFCRKCKFDLAGSPIETVGDKCPECGQEIYTQSSRRISLRRSSRIGLVLSLGLLIIGIASSAVGITGSSAAIYALMPDGIIVHLTTIGSEGALDELGTRLTRVPPMSDPHINQLIAHALKVQADPLAPWDPIYGQLLSDAWISGRLSEIQVNQYLDHGLDIQYLIRERVRPGSRGIQFEARITPGRIHAINGTESGRSIKVGIMSSTIGDESARHYRSDSKPLVISHSGINIPKPGSNWKYTNSLELKPIEADCFSEPGEELSVAVNIELSLASTSYRINPSEDDPLSRHYKTIIIDRTVKVLEVGEALIEVRENPTQLKALKEHYKISEVRMLTELDPQRDSWTPVLGFSMMKAEGFADPLAFRVYLRVGDGVESQEVEIGKAVHEQTSGGGAFGTSITWVVDPENPEESKRAAELFALIQDRGKADVIFRSDPEIAEDNPTIDHILDATLTFPDVPIKQVENYGEIWMVLRDPQWRAVEED